MEQKGAYIPEPIYIVYIWVPERTPRLFPLAMMVERAKCESESDFAIGRFEKLKMNGFMKLG